MKLTDFLLVAILIASCKPAPPKNPDIKLEPGANLAGLEFRDVDWNGVNLTGANLAGLQVSQSYDAEQMKCSGCNFTDANLSSSSLDFDCPGCNLRGANFSNGIMWGNNWSGCDFTGANLAGVNFTSADLTGANFTDANLQGASLVNANVSGADFTSADFSGVRLEDANLTGANLNGAKMNCLVLISVERLVLPQGYILKRNADNQYDCAYRIVPE